MPSYARAGVARGISQGLGTISQALMGIQQRRVDEEERARQAAEDAQRQEYLGLQTKGLRRDLSRPDPVPTPFSVEVDGVRGQFATPDDALAFRDRVPQPTPRLRGPANREFPDTPEGQAALLDWERQMGAAGRAPQEPQEVPGITVGGRKFPDTPEGQQAAIAWQRSLGEAGREPPAPDAGPDLNAEQGKSVQFYQRGAPALAALEKLVREQGPPGAGSRIMGAVPLLGNRLQGPHAQLYDATVNELVTALLRKDSGATITPAEMEIARDTYIPRTGEAPEVVEQKLAAARRALESLRSTAGAGAGLMDAGTGGTQQPRRYSPDNPFAPGTQ